MRPGLTVAAAAHVVGLFLFSLEIPLLSPAALICISAWAGYRLLTRPPRLGPFIWRFALLVSALFLHFLIAIGHDLVPPIAGIARTVASAAAYIAGYWAGQDDCPSPHFSKHLGTAGLLAAIFGSVLYALLSLHLALQSGTLDIATLASPADRWTPHPWRSGVQVNAPGVGALSALAMVLLPPVLLAPTDSTRRRTLPLAMFVAALGGIAVNLVLQNRTPFVALGASIVFGVLLLTFSREPSITRKSLWLATIAVAVAVVVSAPLTFGSLSSLGITQRFESEGFRTARYELWLYAAMHMFDTLDGGRAFSLPESFVHNLWLDVAWDSGPVTFFLLLLFHLVHAQPALMAFRTQSLFVRLLLASIGTAFFATFMTEPALYLPLSFFPLSCYLAGLLLALSVASTTRHRPPTFFPSY